MLSVQCGIWVSKHVGRTCWLGHFWLNCCTRRSRLTKKLSVLHSVLSQPFFAVIIPLAAIAFPLITSKHNWDLTTQLLYLSCQLFILSRLGVFTQLHYWLTSGWGSSINHHQLIWSTLNLLYTTRCVGLNLLGICLGELSYVCCYWFSLSSSYYTFNYWT